MPEVLVADGRVTPVNETTTRRVRAITAGHRADEREARRGLTDADPRVRSAAVGALASMGALSVTDVIAGLHDTAPAVRRRAANEAVRVGGRGSRSELVRSLVDALDDPDPLVVESAAWSLGERRSERATAGLASVARTHPDARCRETAVAALGAIGSADGLQAILESLNDKPSIRRRGAVALAAFDGPRVDEALRRCTRDRDWQVREIAEILLDLPPG
ncbi:MAG: HEAT repeat domain-containing protein [Actinomycetota bacterium]|nr:HEAT repeat domain-containing protein [Actinomycetota bacterium]